MRALTALAAAAVLASGCETAFVGRAPSGRFELVEVNGRALPHERAAEDGCRTTVTGGHFDLDALARRFEMRLRESDSCSAAALRVVRVAGSYLRRDGRLALEADPAGGRRGSWSATASGNAVSLDYEGLRLRFRQSERPRP